MSYWKNRMIDDNNKLYDYQLNKSEKNLAKIYQKSFKNIEKELSVLYDKIELDSITGKISFNDFYKFNRWYDLQKSINAELKKIGEAELQQNTDSFLDMYNQVSKHTTKHLVKNLGSINTPFGYINTNATDIIGHIWCADGKHFSTRIWDNKSLLQQRLEDGIQNAIVQGKTKNHIVKDIMNSMNVGLNQADRIVRTELAYVQNTATVNSYKKAGISKVQTIVADDERMCELCGTKADKIFDIGDAVSGVAYLYHPFVDALLYQ